MVNISMFSMGLCVYFWCKSSMGRIYTPVFPPLKNQRKTFTSVKLVFLFPENSFYRLRISDEIGSLSYSIACRRLIICELPPITPGK